VHAAVQTETLIEALKTGHPSEAQLVTAFAYLQLKKRHFRSGYNREAICRALKKVPLNEDQKAALCTIVLEQIEYAGREFGAFAKLVPLICSPHFEQRVRAYAHKGRPYVQERIARIIDSYFRQ